MAKEIRINTGNNFARVSNIATNRANYGLRFANTTATRGDISLLNFNPQTIGDLDLEFIAEVYDDGGTDAVCGVGSVNSDSINLRKEANGRLQLYVISNAAQLTSFLERGEWEAGLNKITFKNGQITAENLDSGFTGTGTQLDVGVSLANVDNAMRLGNLSYTTSATYTYLGTLHEVTINGEQFRLNEGNGTFFYGSQNSTGTLNNTAMWVRTDVEYYLQQREGINDRVIFDPYLIGTGIPFNFKVILNRNWIGGGNQYLFYRNGGGGLLMNGTNGSMGNVGSILQDLEIKINGVVYPASTNFTEHLGALMEVSFNSNVAIPEEQETVLCGTMSGFGAFNASILEYSIDGKTFNFNEGAFTDVYSNDGLKGTISNAAMWQTNLDTFKPNNQYVEEDGRLVAVTVPKGTAQISKKITVQGDPSNHSFSYGYLYVAVKPQRNGKLKRLTIRTATDTVYLNDVEFTGDILELEQELITLFY